MGIGALFERVLANLGFRTFDGSYRRGLPARRSCPFHPFALLARPMPHLSFRKLSWLVALSMLFSSLCSADELLTKDGRLLTIKKARQLPDGNYELTFANGQITCAPSMVASVEIEGDMSDYVPKNDRERENLAKGYVRHKGKWMSKQSYKTLLKKEAEARRARLEELEKHSSFRNGYELETRHFTFKSNTSKELLDYYSNLLEAYYKLMDNRVGINPTPTLKRTKMHVNIYKSRDDWGVHTQVPNGVVGFFSSFEQTLNFFHDIEDPSISSYIALHECTHLLTYLIQPTFSPRIWVNEGVADYFGSSTINVGPKGKIEIIPGKLQVDRMLTVRNAIEDGSFVPLAELFQIEKPDFHAFQYAHAWSFVYFLNNHPSYSKRFKKFFKDFYTLSKKVKFTWQGQRRVVSADETQRLLLASIKKKAKDIPKLEREWLDFIRQVDIDAPDALFRRGLRVVRQRDSEDYEQAGEDLTAAMDAGVEDARLFWALGVIKSQEEKQGEQAIELLQQAIELAPFTARFRASLGTVQMRYAFDGAGEESEGQLSALRSLGLATELAPDSDYYREMYEDAKEQFSKFNRALREGPKKKKEKN